MSGASPALVVDAVRQAIIGSELVCEVDLPDVNSADELDLHLDETQFRLSTASARSMVVAFVMAVHSDGVVTRFARKRHRLTIPQR